MSSLRYSFVATLKGKPLVNENGDPTGEYEPDISFDVDYQPSTVNEEIKFAGTFVNVQYKLFVQSTEFRLALQPLLTEASQLILTDHFQYICSENDLRTELQFLIGAEIECNNIRGIIVSVFPTKRNTEIWVK